MNLSFTSTSTKPYLRTVRVSDAPNIVEVRYAAIERYSEYPVGRRMIKEDIENVERKITNSNIEDHMFAVGTDPKDIDKVLGFIEYKQKGDALIVDHLYAVKNDMHLGAHLLSHTVQVAEYLGLNRIILDASEGAQKFYSNFDFQKLNDASGPGSRMVLPLSKANKLRPR